VERGVEGTLLDAQHVVGDALDGAGDAIAMEVAGGRFAGGQSGGWTLGRGGTDGATAADGLAWGGVADAI
jgi:hypothetical protein